MRELSEDGKQIVAEVAERHGIGTDAVAHLLRAVWSGQGTQAQFNHPELGGMGQWSQGGMTMIGDMFNTSLKARVDSLCTELSGIVSNQTVFEMPVMSPSQTSGAGRGTQGSGGWPAELGQPSSQGAQNNMRYACFPDKRRLAIDIAGRITVYDTADHQISGFAQAQSGGQSLSFTSQHGQVQVSDLRVVSDADPVEAAQTAPAEPTPANRTPEPSATDGPSATRDPMPTPVIAVPEVSDEQIFARIERLADLYSRDILSQEEFEAKKAELLARL
ncbi:SHOCT domain-containing protein [Puniceibacterium confluentis]|uniref:SHOCT domain-containing protein n=1 Tax=Puniceibacterium confluentis TaxID=1958944 RepID=UPI0035684280